MQLDRRYFTAGLATTALAAWCGPSRGAAEGQGLFWQVSRNGQPNAVLFGYERTSATITADIVRDGDRFVDGAQRLMGAMPNFKMPPVDITKTGLPPLVERLQPAAAQRVRDFVAGMPQMNTPIDKISGIAFTSLVLLEGQTPPTVTVGGTIAEHAQAAGKPISYLLSIDDIKSILRPPDIGTIERQVDDNTVGYLLGLRDKVGPVGKYLETMYVTRRVQDLKSATMDMRSHGVPQLEAVAGLPPDQLQSMLTTRARELFKQPPQGELFVMLPLGTLDGDADLLRTLRQDGMEVTPVA